MGMNTSSSRRRTIPSKPWTEISLPPSDIILLILLFPNFWSVIRGLAAVVRLISPPRDLFGRGREGELDAAVIAAARDRHCQNRVGILAVEFGAGEKHDMVGNFVVQPDAAHRC